MADSVCAVAQAQTPRAALVLPHVALELHRSEVWRNSWQTLRRVIVDFRWDYFAELWCLQTPSRLLPAFRPSKFSEAKRIRAAKKVFTGCKVRSLSEVEQRTAEVSTELQAIDKRRSSVLGADVVDEDDSPPAGDDGAAGDEEAPPPDEVAEPLGVASRFGMWDITVEKAVQCGAMGIDPALVPDDHLVAVVEEVAAVVAEHEDLVLPAAAAGVPLAPAPPSAPLPVVPVPCPVPGPAIIPAAIPVVPSAIKLMKNERIVKWHGVKRFVLSEIHPSGEFTAYQLRCLSHRNDHDVAGINGYPECKTSLTFKTKRISWQMPEGEARLKLKYWAVRGCQCIAPTDPRAREKHTCAPMFRPRDLDIYGITEDMVDAWAVELTASF